LFAVVLIEQALGRCYIMDKIDERLAALSAAAQGRLGHLVTTTSSSREMGEKVGELFSHNSIRTLPQSRRAPIERGLTGP
jgi:hypothetical protein